MQLVVRTIIFHIICIVLFTAIYYLYRSQFLHLHKDRKYESIYDFLLLSISLQGSVGFSDVMPVSSLCKLLVSLQIIIMMSTHLITIYFFTL